MFKVFEPRVRLRIRVKSEKYKIELIKTVA